MSLRSYARRIGARESISKSGRSKSSRLDSAARFADDSTVNQKINSTQLIYAETSVKITDVRTVLLTGPCTDDPFLSEARKRRSAAFIEIYTDTELVGLGETYAGYFCPELVPGTVAFFAPILIGQTVDNIAELWARMYRCENFWCRVGLG